MKIKNHWLTSARRLDSPHFDQRPNPRDISLIVIHGISLPPGEFGGHYVDDFFLGRLDPNHNPYFAMIFEHKLSSHLFIDRAGRITQYVAFDQRARHAGESVFEGRHDCNDFSIGIELEGTDETPYADTQVEIAALVSRTLLGEYPMIVPERIVGHSDIAPGRKTDPGPHFDWQRFKILLNAARLSRGLSC